MIFNKYYLGSSTADGFISFFSDCMNCREGRKIYILKGGPGTGKSTLMKRIAEKAKQNGESVSLCPCSADPDSIDAVVLSDRKVTVLDGTAPHVVEPVYAGIGEEIVNLGEAFKKRGFEGKREVMLDLYSKNSAFHSTAARYLCAAGKLFADSRMKVRDCADSDRTVKFALSLADRLFSKNIGEGKLSRVYLSAPTVNGRVFLKDSLINSSEQMVVIEDEYRALSPLIMNILKDKAIGSGYDVAVCYSPYLPSLTPEHLFFPQLNISVVTQSRLTDFSDSLAVRIIHSRRFINPSSLRAKKSRLLFNRKAAIQLIDAACGQITEAKKIHDELESHYINAMDFSRAEEMSAGLIDKIFS